MDQVWAYVKPLKDFSKDSMRLVKRCTKPDIKGKFVMTWALYVSSLRHNFVCRISENSSGYSGGVCHHGIHWILCEADPHTHQ